MEPSAVDREIARFDPDVAIEAAWTPPASWYVDHGVFEREMATVFRNHWTAVARDDVDDEPGSYVTGEQLDRQHVIVRGEDGELRAFHNVCRHHAARVATGAGRCEELECPYHGWAYHLDGALKRAPRSGGIEGFDRTEFGLVSLALESWGPLLFVHDGPGRAPLRAALDGLATFERELVGLEFVTQREYRLQCNWKVYVDNYLDGGYHVPVLHRALGAQLALDSYRTEVFDQYVTQSCGADGEAEPAGGDFGDRVRGGAEYVWIYPNLMVNRYGPILDVNRVVPLSVDETLVVFDYWFEPSRVRDVEFVAESLGASERVQDEDTMICESVQKGLISTAYDRGRYAPKLEAGEHQFHRLLAVDLRATTPPAARP